MSDDLIERLRTTAGYYSDIWGPHIVPAQIQEAADALAAKDAEIELLRGIIAADNATMDGHVKDMRDQYNEIAWLKALLDEAGGLLLEWPGDRQAVKFPKSLVARTRAFLAKLGTGHASE